MENDQKSVAVTESVQLPIIDLDLFLNKGEGWEQQCALVCELLHKYGILFVKDPRVDMQHNETFLDMLEDYFNQPEAETAGDIKPELAFQVGATPSGTEIARNHCAKIAAMPDESKPLTICPPEADPKWRFFWRIGERPANTRFNSLNAPQVIPPHFPQWSEVMNTWGSLMLAACETVAEMAAVGAGLPVDAFRSLMQMGPHLLAPTGSDLVRHGELGTVFAKYHYDLNFLTIHGRSRYPGLYAWLRDGTKMQVKVPPQCLLLQAGKQFEWLTGGYVLNGFHEVIVDQDTLAAKQRRSELGRPLWRVSSTLFSHIASDNLLQPLGHFATPEALAAYPPTFAGQQVSDELAAIKLSAPNSIVSM
eukprot:TRINITY_DN601_c0_g1_i4.p1 TRINITY_DN601_c0_g1~~TRINITY_DN601_c0_g1_i4.p1  ORF type:complete len:363 (+),score=141.14 TRINITY_DN601_c0_g1_i4:114-1202(+)